MSYRDIVIKDKQWHDGPYIDANGTIRVTRNSENSKNVTVNGTLTMSMTGNYNRPPSNAYQPPDYTTYKVLEYSGLTSWIKANGKDKLHRTYNGYSDIQSSKKIGNQQMSKSTTFTHTFNNVSVKWTEGNLEIYSGCIWLTDGTCDQGWGKTRIGLLEFDKLPYNEYKDPTISISASPEISNYDSNRTISVAANTSGDSTATTVYVTVNGNEEKTSIGNDSKNYTFKPSDKGVNAASSYSVKARRVHSKKANSSATSNTLTLYTYKLPSITDFSFSSNTISGNAKGSPTINWSCNNRKWKDHGEAQFETYISYNNGSSWSKLNNNKPTIDDASNTAQSMVITQSWINDRLDKNARSQNSSTINVKMLRKNESSGKTSETSNKVLTVNFKPTKTINSNNILYYKCKSNNVDPDTSISLTARKYLLYR